MSNTKNLSKIESGEFCVTCKSFPKYNNQEHCLDCSMNLQISQEDQPTRKCALCYLPMSHPDALSHAECDRKEKLFHT